MSQQFKPFKNGATYQLRGHMERFWLANSYQTWVKNYFNKHDTFKIEGVYCVNGAGDVVHEGGHVVIPSGIRHWFKRVDNKKGK